MDRQLAETRLFALQDILESFTSSFSELQVWSVAFQALKFCEKCLRQQEDLTSVKVDLTSVYVNCLGDVIFSGMRDHNNDGSIQMTVLQRADIVTKMLEALGTTLFECLDYGVRDDEERVLSEELERLITLMTMRDASSLNGSITLADTDADADSKAGNDEGILNDFATDGDSVALASDDEDEQLDYVLKLQRFCALNVTKLPMSFSRSNSRTDAHPAEECIPVTDAPSTDSENTLTPPSHTVCVAAARRCAAECAALHARAMRIALLLERARASVLASEALERDSLCTPALDAAATSASQRRWAAGWLRLVNQLAVADRRSLKPIDLDADALAAARTRSRLAVSDPIEAVLRTIRQRNYALRHVETLPSKPTSEDVFDLRTRLCIEVLRARANLRSSATVRHQSPHPDAPPKPTSSHEKLLDEIHGGVQLRSAAGGIAQLEAENSRRRKSCMLSLIDVERVRSDRPGQLSHRSSSQPRRKNASRFNPSDARPRASPGALARPNHLAAVDRRRQSVPENQLSEQAAMRLRSASPGVASLDDLDSVDEVEHQPDGSNRISSDKARNNNYVQSPAAKVASNPANSSLENTAANSLASAPAPAPAPAAPRRVVKAAQCINFDDSSDASSADDDEKDDNSRHAELQQSIALAFGRDSAQRFSLRRSAARSRLPNRPETSSPRSGDAVDVDRRTRPAARDATLHSTPNGTRLHSSATVPNMSSVSNGSSNASPAAKSSQPPKTSPLFQAPKAPQSPQTSQSPQSPQSPQAPKSPLTPACLELTLAEVRNVRQKCADADLETLRVDSELFVNVKAGRVCFNCLKTRFGFFQKGTRCTVCTRQSCPKCTRQLRVPQASAGRFEKLPVLALSEQLHNVDLSAYATAAFASANSSRHPSGSPTSVSARSSPMSTPVRSAPTLQRATASSSALHAESRNESGRSHIDVCDGCVTLLKQIVANCAKELHRKGLLNEDLIAAHKRA